MTLTASAPPREHLVQLLVYVEADQKNYLRQRVAATKCRTLSNYVRGLIEDDRTATNTESEAV